jgi:acetyl-CoA carboxylase carboxyltransferase component
VLLRKASGAGYYAMAGMPYDPIAQLATPISRLAVMEGRTLAIGAFNTKLDDNFDIVASSEEEREKIRQGMAAVEARITADMDPVKAAAQMDVDEVVRFDEIRSYLEVLIEASYQASGYRRVKNPRIWSLHDIAILGEVGL